MAKKLPQTIRLKVHEAEMLKEKAFELSMKKSDFVKESEIVHFLIENYIDKVDVDKGELTIK
jgi:hypothetical protein